MRYLLAGVLMFIALASFHPGFRITSMPAVILIAFAVFMIAFTLANPKFLSVDNVFSVVRSSARPSMSGSGVVGSAIPAP